METVKEWFGKGCKYLSAQWENNDTPKDSEPVLQFCNHKDNPEDTEGNCRHNICPLLIAVFNESMRTEVDLRDVTIREVSKSMHLTDEQRRMLTEKLLVECWTQTATARQCVDCTHSCTISNRTFLTPQDLMDCKEALVKKGLWEKFIGYVCDRHVVYGYGRALVAEFNDWLFRTTDKNGKAHFCRLVAEFLEA